MPAHQHDTVFARRHRGTVGVDQPDLITRDRRAGGTYTVVIMPVRQIDMQKLGRTQPLGRAVTDKTLPAS